MFRRAIALVFALTLGLSIALPALADYRDVRFDPDDREVLGEDADIRSSTRSIFRQGGRRYLSIQVRAYEDFSVYYSIRVPLDTRGGPKADYFMNIYNADNSGRGCSFWPRHHRWGWERGAFWQHGDRVRCRVPLPSDPRGKRIRWRLYSPSTYGGVTEYAPDEGWYS